jgi:hypothetical protein
MNSTGFQYPTNNQQRTTNNDLVLVLTTTLTPELDRDESRAVGKAAATKH